MSNTEHSNLIDIGGGQMIDKDLAAKYTSGTD